jgi:F-type H+-transporting ATPase subunit b
VIGRHRAATLLGCLLLPATAQASGGETGPLDMIWRIGNLALLFVVLFLLARKPIQGFFAARRDGIQGQVQEAAKLRKEAEELHARWQRQLVDLDAELERIRASASERAETERERILADAEAGAERIRNDARSAVDQELRRARKELREEAADLAIQLAGEMLRGQVNDADRDRLVDEFISKVDQPGQGSRS